MAIMPGVGPGAHGRLVLNGKRMATATKRLPERWREMVLQQGHGFADIPLSAMTKPRANIC